MAEIKVGTAAGYAWYLSCEQLSFSQSVANNTSTLKLGLYLRSTTSSTWVSFDVRSAYIGDSKFTIDYKHTGGKHKLGEKTYTIKHNANGTASFSCSYGISTSYALNGSGTYSRSIPTIARASSISSISGSTLGSAVTVNISRQASNFTHDVTYWFGSIKRTYTGQSTSCTFTPPLSDGSQIPSATSGQGSITVQTKSGSTNIGSAVSKTFTLNMPASVVPTYSSLSVARVDNGVPAAWGIYVAGFSKATLTINGAAGAQGSTIKGYNISGGGYSSASNSFTTGALNAGTQTFTGVVTDSRGRTASKTASVSVVAYATPTLSMTAQRCNSAGTVDANGTYVKVVPTYSCASCSGKNSITSKRFEVVSTSSANTSCASGSSCVLGAGALDISKTYTIRGTVTDALGKSATLDVTIPTAARVVNIKSNNKGVAFGKMSEKDNALESAWPVYAQGQRLANISETCVNRGRIPAGANLNSYTTTGYYHQPLNDDAKSGTNYPIAEAGMLMVYNPGYVYQTYTHYYGAGTWARTYYEYDKHWSTWAKLAKTTDVMNPTPHHHNYDMWSGSQLLSTAGWIGWYDGHGGSAKRKGWIGHDGTTDFYITNNAGGRVIINRETVVQGRFNVNNLGYISGYTANNSTRMWIGVVGDNDHVYIGDNATGTVFRGKYIRLGSANGATVTSDRNLKTDINKINQHYKNFFKSLNPVSYKYDMEGHKRSHLGFIAQEVEEALKNNELTTNDFAGVCIDEVGDYEVDRNDPEIKAAKEKGLDKLYSLRYEEFISLNTAMIQEHEKEIESIKNSYDKKLSDLEKRIEQLESLLR